MRQEERSLASGYHEKVYRSSPFKSDTVVRGKRILKFIVGSECFY